ncbi:hypothetical protein [Streptomyces drozdowiczii]|uniref:hypothetical protein n=1 Tax=Streptomyces drozdowiczii TaxID=202862 RepID=UPI00403CA75F
MFWLIGMHKKAEKVLHGASLKGDENAAWNLSTLLMQDGRLGAAAEVLADGVAGAVPGAALRLASILSELPERGAEAEGWYKKAIKEGDMEALNDYGCYLSSADRIDEARQILKRAIDIGDKFAAGNLARLEFDEGNFAKATSWFLKASAQGDMSGLALLARAEVKVGKSVAARQHLAEARLADAPGVNLAHAEILIAEDENNPEEILGAFDKAAEKGEEGASFVRARWLADCGKVNEAILAYEMAATEGEKNAHMNVALLYEKVGDASEAEIHFRAGVKAGDEECAVNFAIFLAADGRLEDLGEFVGTRQFESFSLTTREEIVAILNSLRRVE